MGWGKGGDTWWTEGEGLDSRRPLPCLPLSLPVRLPDDPPPFTRLSKPHQHQHQHPNTHAQILTSNKWGFTQWDREEYVRRRIDGSLVGDGVGVQYVPAKGKLPDLPASA